MDCWLLFLVLFCFSVSTVHFGNCNKIEVYLCEDISVGFSFLCFFFLTNLQCCAVVIVLNSGIQENVSVLFPCFS